MSKKKRAAPSRAGAGRQPTLTVADKWQVVVGVATGLAAVGTGVLAIGWKLVGAIFLGLAACIFIALPFSIFLGKRVGAAGLLISLVGVGLGIGIFFFSQPQRVNWCNTAQPPITPAYLSDASQSSSGLQLIRVLASEEVGQTACIRIDLSLLNGGEDAIFIKRAAVQIVDAWPVLQTCVFGGKGGGGVPIAANYNATLNVAKVPSISYVDQVSQHLSAQDFDRFTITARLIGGELDAKVGLRVIEARVKVFYNANSETAWSKPFLFSSNPALSPQEFANDFGEARPSDGVGPFINQLAGAALANHRTAVTLSRLSVARTGRVEQIQRFLLSRIIPSCPP